MQRLAIEQRGLRPMHQRLRLGQQPQRLGGQRGLGEGLQGGLRGGLCCGRCCCGWCCCGGPQPRRVGRLPARAALGPVVGHRGQALHLRRAQPGLQPLHQARQAFALTAAAGKQLGIGRRAGHQLVTQQAELQRGRGQRQPAQVLSQQAVQVFGVGHRLGQRDVQRGVRWRAGVAPAPGLMVHQQAEAGHPGPAGIGPGQQPGQQPLGTGQHLGAGVGPAQQLDPAGKTRRQGEPDVGLGGVAAGAVDLVQQCRTKTPGQAGARQAAQVGQGVQAHALQCGAVLAARAQGRQRHGVEQGLQQVPGLGLVFGLRLGPGAVRV